MWYFRAPPSSPASFILSPPPPLAPAANHRQGYKMKDEALEALRNGGERLEGGIRTAVELWCTDPAAAKQQYGPIASWNTSEITNMYMLFRSKADFNGDISRWDVSSVTDMRAMFAGATSFNGDLSQWDVSKVTDMAYMLRGATSLTHQLGGAWSTSTADRYRMFHNCPGSIAGKTNNADGTPK